MSPAVIPRCIFTGNPILDPGDEHILPSALGGRLHSSGLVEREVNVRLGHEVDAPFVRNFDFVRNLFDIRGADGQTAPAIVGSIGEGSERVRVYPQGKLCFAQPHFERVTSETGKRVRIRYRGVKEAQQQLRSLKRAYPANRIRATFAQFAPGSVRIEWRFDGVSLFRGIAKISLELLGHALGNDFALRREFDQVRAFVMSGAGEIDSLVSYYSSPFPRGLASFGPLTHTLFLSHGERGESVQSLVRLFGHFDFQCVLSESVDTLPFQCAYVFDPVSGQDFYDRNMVPVNLSAIPSLQETIRIESSGEGVAALQSRFEALVHVGQMRLFRAMIERTVNEVLGPTDGRQLTQEDIDRLAAALAERIHVAMLPAGTLLSKRIVDI